MISIGGKKIEQETDIGPYKPDSLKGQVLHILYASEKNYDYPSVRSLEFELDLREKIVRSAERLNGTRFEFETFKNSRCNPDFWTRTPEGGFLLKPGISPYKAIRDFYDHSSLYGTECATAVVIVLYLALTEILPEGLFNSLFSDIYLMDWKYLDKDLGMRSYDNLSDYLPADIRYFKNPDVDPSVMEWQGENSIQLMNNYFYGHGVGIKTADSMINSLNKHRKPGGLREAYLMDLAIRPGYRFLFKQLDQYTSSHTTAFR